jgi:signal transduction histidine kinase
VAPACGTPRARLTALHTNHDEVAPEVEATAYFVVAEALTNVAKRAYGRRCASATIPLTLRGH